MCIGVFSEEGLRAAKLVIPSTRSTPSHSIKSNQRLKEALFTMSNSTNLFTNSQHLNTDSEQKKIIDTLYRCSKEELLLALYAKKLERGIDSADVRQYLQYSDSAASSILRRLTDPVFNKKLITPIMTRERYGAKGAWLYFVKDEVMLEDIEKICQARGYSYQKFIENQRRKNSKQNDVTYQKENTKTSTDIPIQERKVDNCGVETDQTETVKTVASEKVTAKSVEFENPLDTNFTGGEFPFLFEVFKNQLAEKDRQIQKLQGELDKFTSYLLKQKAV